MSARGEAIRGRRAILVERAAVERESIAAALEPWAKGLAVVERGRSFLAGLRKSAPLLGMGLGLAGTALAIVRPSRIAGWFRGARALWSLARSVAGRL